MRTIRLVLILVLGGYLTYLSYKSKYGVSITDAFISGGLILLGAILVLWTITTDITLYKSQKKIQSFALTSICFIFTTVIVILQIQIVNYFNKPTLLKVHYNGDFNGTAIDFKTDGTYIFDNSSIGFSDYYYGVYQINDYKITLDRDTIDNLINLKHLELREKRIEYESGGKNELYLYSVDVNSNIIDRATEYRVVVDNREN